MAMSKTVQKTASILCRLGCLGIVFVLVPVATAWGQAPPPIGGASQEKSYVYQYMLVILCIALGLVLLCRPRKRAEEVEKVKEL